MVHVCACAHGSQTPGQYRGNRWIIPEKRSSPPAGVGRHQEYGPRAAQRPVVALDPIGGGSVWPGVGVPTEPGHS